MNSGCILCFLLPSAAHAQNPTTTLLIGTDIPYQYSIGTEVKIKNVRFSLRTGLLVDPYSELTLKLLQAFGTDETYIRLLEASYQFGTMNGIGAQYLFGKDKHWYVGPEFRFDYVTASDTSSDLINTVIGDTRSLPPRFGNQEQEVRLGLWMLAAGIRTGRTIPFGNSENHHLHVELSFYKHYKIQTLLSVNDQQNEGVSEALDELLWEDVFQPYGYLGGFGLTYSYSL